MPLPPPRKDDLNSEAATDVEEAVDRLLQRLEGGADRGLAAELAQLLAEHPDHHMTNYGMGVYQAIAARDPKRAIGYFEKAVAIYPRFPEALYNLGLAARQVFNIPKAVDSLRLAQRHAQDHEIVELAQQELQWLERLVLKNSLFHNLDAYVANARLFERAFDCLRRRQFTQAVELFERVLRDNPTHVQSHGNLGLALAGLGRRAEALACFDRALELDPSYELARLNRNVIEPMREGDPFQPQMQEMEYYAERLRARR